MKKLLTILTLFAMMLGTAACVKSQSLESALNELNRQCPSYIGEGVTMTRAYDDGQHIAYEYRIDERIIDMDLLSYNQYEVKQSIKSMLNSPKMKEGIDACIHYNKGLSVHYVGDTSGKSVVITFSLQELRGAM